MLRGGLCDGMRAHTEFEQQVLEGAAALQNKLDTNFTGKSGLPRRPAFFLILLDHFGLFKVIGSARVLNSRARLDLAL